jgi:hypothetical protein
VVLLLLVVLILIFVIFRIRPGTGKKRTSDYPPDVDLTGNAAAPQPAAGTSATKRKTTVVKQF